MATVLGRKAFKEPGWSKRDTFLAIPLVLLIVIAIIVLVIYYLRYRKIVGTESDKCPVYSCGFDAITTDPKCVPTADEAKQNPSMYAYRKDDSGNIECQKSRALPQAYQQ